MFKLYDLEMNKIPFPDGVKPLDIFVGSIAKERQTEAIPGRNGIVDFGTNYTERSVELSLWIISSDSIDYRLLRNELYALFDAGNAFYIAESNVPSRVLKVAVDDSYIPERITRKHASVEITCRTLDSVFWESTYTTLELHDSGYSAIAEKYGLVDNIGVDKTKYQFEPSRATQSLVNESFKYGFLSSSTGKESTHTNNIITSGYVRVYPGIEYEFEDTGAHPTLNYWWIYEYDDSNNFIKATATNTGDNRKQHIFITEGSKLRFMANPNSGESIDLAGVGDDILPYLRRDATNNSFNVYNAGNVTIEPEFMPLQIEIRGLRNISDFSIKNLTTGEEFIYNGKIEGYTLRIKDMQVMYSGVYNHLRQTNRKFISLAPGLNEFEISGGTFEFIYFDFQYYYK